MIWLLLLFIGAVMTIYFSSNRRNMGSQVLSQVNKTVFVDDMTSLQQNAVNIKALEKEKLVESIVNTFIRTFRRLGDRAKLKLFIFTIFSISCSFYINASFFRVSSVYFTIFYLICSYLCMGVVLKNREVKEFESTFPDALNLLTNAVSSGESVMQAINYVGDNVNGPIGKEFRLMAERMKIGETAENVFRKSCKALPYPSFYFFVITIRINLQRGGQLKDVLNRLNRLMFNARSIEKKKYSLTSEARMSAKVVGTIPFIFLMLLQYISPENYEFVMFSSEGKPILYYMLISEFIGMLIIFGLMRSIKV